MTTILVTGASGFVGSHLVPALLGAGHRVIALAHTPGSAETVLRRLKPDLRAGVETRLGDVTAPATLGPAFDGVEALIHLVAIPRDFDGGASLRLVNTEGTRNVVTAARAAGVRRLVHLGALGVADDPDLHYASSKARAEAIVATSDLDWTILRPSLLWGERDGFFNIVASLVRYAPGVVPVPGRGTARFQPLWIGDLARIVVETLANPEATVGRSFDLGGPRCWTYREITRAVMQAMGRPGIIVPMPVPLISLVAGVAERVRLPFPAATDQLRQLRLDNVGPLDGVAASFGFEPVDMAGRLGYLRRRLRDQEPTIADQEPTIADHERTIANGETTDADAEPTRPG
ncbi:MAG TPA: complex I NDUFA9 subunit family protein [Candidatus Limnocylindrales bacterium]|nr:complex I NDUFA9 subunit family protein [Candidatus Limnocylindrales bacterium]